MAAIDILTATELSLVRQLELLRLFIVFKKLFPNMPFDSFVKSAVFDENGSALYSAALRTKNVWGQREIADETKVTLLSYYADMLDEHVELPLTEYLTEVFESEEGVDLDEHDEAPDVLLAPVETPEDSDYEEILESVAQTVTKSDLVNALALLAEPEPDSPVGSSLLRLAHAEFTHENGPLDFVVEISTAQNYYYVDAYLLAGGEDVVAEHPPIRDLDFVGQNDSDDCTPLTIRYDDKDYSLALFAAASDEVAPV